MKTRNIEVDGFMDWNLKSASWDFSEFDQEPIPNIDVIDGSRNCGDRGTEVDFSVDLKLGRMSNYGDETGDNLKDFWVSEVFSPSGGSSSKRARSAHYANQTVSCLVDGCTSDLSICRDYHRRHKVCERHSKTPVVTIDGKKRRFCQQCSRFHSLEEFDEGKRSCRKRLDGHNRRRRKPQPEQPTLHSGSYYLSNCQGALSGSSHIYPTTSLVEEAGIFEQRPQLNLLDKQNLFAGSSYSSSPGEGKQLGFWQNSAGASDMVFNDGLTAVPNSDCALSLLSSMHTSEISVSPPNAILLAQSQVPSLNYNSSLEEPLDSAASVHFQGMFHISNDAPQKLPLYWD